RRNGARADDRRRRHPRARRGGGAARRAARARRHDGAHRRHRRQRLARSHRRARPRRRRRGGLRIAPRLRRRLPARHRRLPRARAAARRHRVPRRRRLRRSRRGRRAARPHRPRRSRLRDRLAHAPRRPRRARRPLAASAQRQLRRHAAHPPALRRRRHRSRTVPRHPPRRPRAPRHARPRLGLDRRDAGQGDPPRPAHRRGPGELAAPSRRAQQDLGDLEGRPRRRLQDPHDDRALRSTIGYDFAVAAAVVVERSVDCKSSVADLWRVLTDTSYLNRLTGEAPRQIAEISASDGARYRIKTKAGGFNVEWEEWPFEWEHQQRFRVFRKFKAGPVDTVDTALTFAAREDGGARVGIRLALVPKIAWLAWMVRFGTRRAADALVLSVRAVDEALSRRAPLPLPSSARPPEITGGLERAQRALREKAPSPELVDRLCDWIRMARD